MDRRVGLGVGMQLSIGAREREKKAVWLIGAWALEAQEEERESAFHFFLGLLASVENRVISQYPPSY